MRVEEDACECSCNATALLQIERVGEKEESAPNHRTQLEVAQHVVPAGVGVFVRRQPPPHHPTQGRPQLAGRNGGKGGQTEKPGAPSGVGAYVMGEVLPITKKIDRFTTKAMTEEERTANYQAGG